MTDKNKILAINQSNALIMSKIEKALTRIELKTVEFHTAIVDGNYMLSIDNLYENIMPVIEPKKEKYWVKFNDCYKNNRK